MSIPLPSDIAHTNPVYAIADIKDIRGGINYVSGFNNTNLSALFSSIPDKVKTYYSLLVDNSTNNLYYLTGNPNNTSGWTLISGGGGSSFTLVYSVTYSSFVAAMANPSTPSGIYRIKDYRTAGFIIGTGDTFVSPDIEVLQVTVINDGSGPVANREVKSELFPDDIIFYDWNLNNWANDAAFSDDKGFADPLYGVIYYRHDTKRDIVASYDWRYFRFRRYYLNAGKEFISSYDPTNTYLSGDLVRYSQPTIDGNKSRNESVYVAMKNGLLPNIQYYDSDETFPGDVFARSDDALVEWMRVCTVNSSPLFSPLLSFYLSSGEYGPIPFPPTSIPVNIGQQPSIYTTAPYSFNLPISASYLDVPTFWFADTQRSYVETVRSVHLSPPQLGEFEKNILNSKINGQPIVFNKLPGKYFSIATDNVFILCDDNNYRDNSSSSDTFRGMMSNLKFDGMCSSNTFYFTPPNVFRPNIDGTEPPSTGIGLSASSAASSFHLSNTKFNAFSGNIVRINYENVIGYSFPNGTKYLRSPFTNNEISSTFGCFFNEGLENCKITSGRGSVFESLKNVTIKNDLNLFVVDGLLFPGSIDGNASGSGYGSIFDVFEPYVFQNSVIRYCMASNYSTSYWNYFLRHACVDIGYSGRNHFHMLRNMKYGNYIWNNILQKVPLKQDESKLGGYHQNNTFGNRITNNIFYWISNNDFGNDIKSNAFGSLGATSSLFQQELPIEFYFYDNSIKNDFRDNYTSSSDSQYFVYNHVSNKSVFGLDFAAATYANNFNITKYHHIDSNGPNQLYFLSSGTVFTNASNA